MTNKKYILDTNIITYLYEVNSPFHEAVEKKLREISTNGEIYVSVLTFFEISFGEAIAVNPKIKMVFEKLRNAIKRDFMIIPVEEKSSLYFGALKAGYKKHTGITKEAVKKHDLDFMLASSAMAEDAVLVSNDEIFEKLGQANPGFRYENWTE